jgi:hypothetical protein
VKKSTRKAKERFEAWKPHMTREDDLILKYLNEVGGGTVFLEVIVGKGKEWPPGAIRRIDAVRIPTSDHNEIVIFKRRINGQRFKDLVKGKSIEVIEAKKRLNRLVIGQAIVGADLLYLDYKPFTIQQVIVCEAGDPLLEMICERRGIKVKVV